MKKNRKTIIIALAVVLVLGAAALALKLLPENPSEDDVPSESIPLFEGIEGDVSHIKAEFLDGMDFDVELLKDENGDAVCKVAGYSDDIEFDTVSFTSMAAALKALSSSRIVSEAPIDISEYGLDKPVAVISFSANDGAEHTLKLGNAAPDGQRYVQADGKEAVHLISAYSSTLLTQDLHFYRAFELLPEYDDELKKVIDGVELTRDETYGSSMVIERLPEEEVDSAGAEFMITSPIERKCNSYTLGEELFTPLFNISDYASLVEDYPEDLSKYGLNDPEAVIKISFSDRDAIMLQIGPAINGQRYFVLGSSGNSVFAAPESVFEFLSVPYVKVMSKMMWVYDITELESADIVLPGETAALSFETDADGKMKAYLDGSECSVNAAKQLYSRMLLIMIEDATDKNVSEAEYSMALHLKNGETHTLEAQSINTRQLSLRLDGEDTGFYCLQRDWQVIAEGLAEIRAGADSLSAA